MIRTLLLFFLLFNFSEYAFSQVVEVWNHQYSVADNVTAEAYDIKVDSQGNAITVGIQVMPNQNIYASVIKVDPDGNLLWIKYYAGTDSTYAGFYSLDIDDNDDIYITGAVNNLIGSTDIATVKYSADGTLLWEQQVNGLADQAENGVDISVCPDGHLYVGAYIADGVNGYDYLVIRYNIDGTLIWSKKYNGPANADDVIYDIDSDNFSNVYVTGRITGTGGWDDIATVKYNPQGDVVWDHVFVGEANYGDTGFTIDVDPESQRVVTGGWSSNGLDFGDGVIFSNDDSGDEVWTTIYHADASIGVSDLFKVQFDGSGNVIVGGTEVYNIPGNFNQDFFVLKLGQAGEIIWDETYDNGGLTSDYLMDLTVSEEGNIYVCGITSDSNVEGDFNTSKWSNDGVYEWSIFFDGYDNNDQCQDLVVSGNNIYVCGSVSNTAGYGRATVVKYCEGELCIDGVAENPNDFSDFNLSPVPADEFLNISTVIPVNFVCATVLASSGHECLNIENSSGIKTIGLSSLAPGMYVLQLTSDEGTIASKRFIVK